MADQFLPQRYTNGQVSQRGGAVAPYQAQAPAHAPGDLHLTPVARSMDECWDLLSPKVRQRMIDRAGTVIDRWFYTRDDDRIAGVLLGSRALVTAEPTFNASGGPATTVQALVVQTGSARSVQVNADTTNERYAPVGARPGARPGETDSSLLSRLPSDFTAFLGNLPRQAQALLQDPFVGTTGTLYCDHYYLETGPAHGAGGRTLQVWCYLTDRRRVAFASGNGVTFGSTFVAARWQLTCRRFDVAGPAGTDLARGSASIK